MAYRIELTESEKATISWLADHGYDAGIWDAMDSNGVIMEYQAWECIRHYNENPGAFLACCGDKGLADKLINFINCVV